MRIIDWMIHDDGQRDVPDGGTDIRSRQYGPERDIGGWIASDRIRLRVGVVESDRRNQPYEFRGTGSQPTRP